MLFSIAYVDSSKEPIEGYIIDFMTEDHVVRFLHDKIQSPYIPFLPTYLGVRWDADRKIITYASGYHLYKPDFKWRVVSQYTLKINEIRTYLLEYESKYYRYRVWFADMEGMGYLGEVGWRQAYNFRDAILKREP